MDRGVTVHTLIQRAGQYVLIKPGVIHWGFNTGPNTAEAANYALPNHDLEITPSPGYELATCESGIIPGAAKSAATPVRCVIGNDTGVAQLRETDLSQISDQFGTGYHKVPYFRKARSKRFNPIRCRRPQVTMLPSDFINNVKYMLSSCTHVPHVCFIYRINNKYNKPIITHSISRTHHTIPFIVIIAIQ